MPAVKAGTENPGFLFLKDLVVFHRCSHVIETAALIQIYILQRADQGSITFEMNERIVTHTAGHKGRILFIDALLRNEVLAGIDGKKDFLVHLGTLVPGNVSGL